MDEKEGFICPCLCLSVCLSSLSRSLFLGGSEEKSSSQSLVHLLLCRQQTPDGTQKGPSNQEEDEGKEGERRERPRTTRKEDNRKDRQHMIKPKPRSLFSHSSAHAERKKKRGRDLRFGKKKVSKHIPLLISTACAVFVFFFLFSLGGESFFFFFLCLPSLLLSQKTR